jgi:hypothetical protein
MTFRSTGHDCRLDDAGPFALFAAPNLTRGRGGRTPPLTDVEWERAIRHGVRREGTTLLMMPSEIFHTITDEDLAPMIAYLKQIPPVDREMPPTSLRIIGRVMVGAEDFVLAMRTGARPRGAGTLNEEMPWKYLGRMTDGELHALWLMLKELPPKQFGEK